MSVRVVILSFAAATGLVAVPAQAQGILERDSARVREACRLAAQILSTGHPDPHYEWALSQTHFCGDSGPVALAVVWQQLADDSVGLIRLVYQSQLLRDNRVLDAVLGVAADAARPDVVRVAALRTIVSYHSPGHDLPSWVRNGETARGACTLSTVDHFPSAEGAQPIDAASRVRIIDALRALSADAGPVGRVAGCALLALQP